ncbi:MAG TPA: hypothetical protein V6D43_21035 [Candidatus Sericytochromatia bacterium]
MPSAVTVLHKPAICCKLVTTPIWKNFNPENLELLQAIASYLRHN